MCRSNFIKIILQMFRNLQTICRNDLHSFLFYSILSSVLLTGCGGGQPTVASSNSTSQPATTPTNTTAQPAPVVTTTNTTAQPAPVVTTTNNTTAQPATVPPPINTTASINSWMSNMRTYGKKWGDYISTNLSYEQAVDAVFYDSERVFYQIADFTGEQEPWNTYALRAGTLYRDQYGVPIDYRLAGYWRFSHGTFMEWQKTKNANLVQTLVKIRDNPNISDPESNALAPTWYSHEYSRPVAYALESNIMTERAGQPRNVQRVNLLVDMAFGHVDQWLTGAVPDVNFQFVQAFMTSITANALIEYYERSVELGQADERIPAKLQTLADWVWNHMWVANVGGTPGNWNKNGGTGYGAFSYVIPNTMPNTTPSNLTNVGTDAPAPALNLLIAPYYAWIYKHTCNKMYRDRADLIFAGGVALTDLGYDSKLFNQNYRNSFNYVKWRGEGDSTCQ